METTSQRTTKIKRILKEHFPDARFKVRSEFFSMGSAIDVYTDALIEYDYEPEYTLSEQEIIKQRKKHEHNNRVKHKIESLLKDYWHIDRDERTGEILSGGNTYLGVYPWSQTQWL